MKEGNEFFVDMAELMHKAGDEIARIIGCEAGMVTSGCYAALVLCAAAVMAGADSQKIERLPDTTGMKNEFLIIKANRNGFLYDRFPSVAGGRLVEIGDEEGTTAKQLEEAVGENTAAIVYAFRQDLSPPPMLTIHEVMEIADQKNIPVILDAAGQTYPLDLMRDLASIGAYTTFGGKYVGAPQSTGFVTGPKENVEKVYLQSFVAYEVLDNKSIGRGYKVDRGEVLATVIAVHEWFAMDHDARIATQNAIINKITNRLSDIKGLSVRQVRSGCSNNAELTFDEEILGISAREVAGLLRTGSPTIRVQTAHKIPPDRFEIAPEHLRPGQLDVLIARIRHILGY
jgi:L-seryl-tRNA(Ser) seleniumtransferase